MIARTLYLRAASAGALHAALIGAGVATRVAVLDEPVLLAVPGVTLQLIGRVSGPADEDGHSEVLPGWHAMVLDVGLTDVQRDALAPLVIDRPDVPGMPVFAGIDEPDADGGGDA